MIAGSYDSHATCLTYIEYGYQECFCFSTISFINLPAFYDTVGQYDNLFISISTVISLD